MMSAFVLIWDSMNRGEIRDAVKQRLAIPASGDGQLTNTVLDDLINRALTVIAGARDWPWLLSTFSLTFETSTGQAFLPNDFIRARQLVYNGYPVLWVQLEDFLNPDRTYATFAWTIIGNKAQITPVPSTDISATLYYYRNEPELISDYSAPLMPSKDHNIIIAYTAYLGAMVRQDDARAATYIAEYRSLLNDMRDDLKQSTSRRIRYGSGYTYASWS